MEAYSVYATSLANYITCFFIFEENFISFSADTDVFFDGWTWKFHQKKTLAGLFLLLDYFAV